MPVATGGASTPAVHSTVPASYRLSVPSWARTLSPVASTWVTIECMCCSTPSLPRVPAALADRLGPNGGQRGAAAVEQQHPGVLGLDVAVLVAQRLGRHLADLAGQLHAGRARRRPGRT